MNCLYTIPLCNFGFAFRHATSVIAKDFGKALLNTKSSPIFFSYKAPFQITVLVRFTSVWFSLVTVLLIVCPRSLLLCPFHKKTENLMEEVLRFLSNR